MNQSGRRWYQFNLQSVLVVITTTGILCGWVAYERAKSATQKAAVEALEKLRPGYISLGYYDDPSPRSAFFQLLLGDDRFGKTDFASLDDPSISDEDLAHLEALPGITELSLGRNITDQGLWHTQHLSQLKLLNLSGTQITDEGISVVRHFPQLTELCLDETRIGDIGLSYLQGMKIKVLLLQHTAITDVGLTHLAGLTNLEVLDLSGTQITDIGLTRVGKIASLTEVDVTQTRVTDAGVKTVHMANRRLVIVNRFGDAISE